jgi:LmbE family N-acetylglucosaminyl deacetylase
MELDLIFQKRNYGGPLRVVCIGAHPDDPETGCGGTLSPLIAAGHKVMIVYLTRGEVGVKYIRKVAVTWNPREARRACGFMGAQIIFIDQPDGATAAGCDECSLFTQLLGELDPDPGL